MRKITILLAFLLMAGLQFANAQTRTISGKVTSSEDGKGIPGVTIVVKGTAVGTVTDLDGNYSLEIEPSYKVLVFQFVGMKTVEITIGNQSTINVAMQQDVLQVDEVVVTAIGIPRAQKALGYTVQDVGADQLQKSGSSEVISALDGRVSGVEINASSGAANAAQRITIRGATSIIGNNQPLFVVDGVPINNNVTRDADGFQTGDVAGVARANRALDIPAEDIESVSVLKGGSASALYGIRGANGVIVITTKKGKKGQGKMVNLNFSSSVQWAKISQTPALNTHYGQGWNHEWASGFFASWGPKLSESGWVKDSDWENSPYKGFDVDGDMVAKGSDRWNSAVSNGVASDVSPYDQFDFFQTGVTYNNTLSLTGGTDKANFYASVSDVQDKGVVPNNNFRRNAYKFSGSTKLGKRWKVSGNGVYIINKANRIQQGSNTSGVMLGLLRTPSSFNNAAGYIFPDGTQRNYRHGGGYDNPYWTANKNAWVDDVNHLIGNLQFDWYPTKWLHIMYRPGIDWSSEQVKSWIAVHSRTSPAGRVFARNTVTRDINQDLIAYGNWDLGENWNLNALLGFNQNERFWQYVYGQANGLSIPDFYALSNSSNVLTGNIASMQRLMGVYFDIGFNFKKMLYVDVTGRNDWSTTLPEQNNSFFYPSFNASWIISELPGLKDSKALPYWKIYANYGITANVPSPYNTLTYYGQAGISDGWVSPLGVNFPISTNGVSYNGFTLSNQVGDNELKPEKTKTFEVGTNIKFVSNRLGLDLSYYNNKSEDLLLPVSIAPSTGFSSMFINAATMTSKGIEATLYATIIEHKNFKWDVTVNYTSFNNVVQSLAENVDNVFLGGFTDPQIRAVVGESYPTIYGYDWLRDDNGNIIIDDDPNSPGYGYPTGDYTLVPLGRVTPTYIIGASTSFSFFGVNVYTLWDFRGGNKMWNGTLGALNYFGASANTEYRDDASYVFEGVKASDGSPNDINVADQGDPDWAQNWATSGEGSGFTGPTVTYIQDVNWIRMKELTVSYSFNELLKDSFVDNLEIYFTGRNLFLSTPYTGIDPNTSLLGSGNAQGMDYFNMPGTKTYMLGLRFAF